MNALIPNDEEITSLVCQARQKHCQGHVAAAIVDYNRALDLIRLRDEPVLEAAVLNDLGGAYHQSGNRRDAGHAYRASLMLREGADPAGEGKVLNNLGVLLAEENAVEEARTCFERALKIKRWLGDHRGEVQTQNNLRNLPK